MKAKIEKIASGVQYMLTLTPDDTGDEKVLKDMGKALDRLHIINCRGFEYGEKSVEFLIQKYSSGRD
jgi:hypothetical protein